MLTIEIPGGELFNDETYEFIPLKGFTIKLEHSLVSISKWESKWHKPFLSKIEKTQEETLDYVKCMTITQNVPEEVYSRLSQNDMIMINNYISNPMSATWFSDDKNQPKGGSGEEITSELVYYWMVAYQIPMECQTWHFNRLINLVRICNIKNQPPKKMKKKDILARNAALNEARKKKLNTRG